MRVTQIKDASFTYQITYYTRFSCPPFQSQTLPLASKFPQQIYIQHSPHSIHMYSDVYIMSMYQYHEVSITVRPLNVRMRHRRRSQLWTVFL